jgi:metal-dependent amidase/aminoacylase/carboxypeptidase family protein
MAANRRSLSGTVKFIFQPAEEAATGARDMIEEGVLENPVPEAIFGVHVTNLQVGQLLCIEGPAMPGVHLVKLTLSGNGNPKSAERSVNRYIRMINSVKKINKSSQDYFRISVAYVEYSSDENRWSLECALFASNDNMFSDAKAEIEKIVTEKSFPDIEVEHFSITRGVPPMINDEDLMRSTYDITQSMLGMDDVIIWKEMPKWSSGEDFSFYQQLIPGVFFFLGASNKSKGFDATPHTPQFAVDEEVIFIGVDLMKSILLEYLQTH